MSKKTEDQPPVEGEVVDKAIDESTTPESVEEVTGEVVSEADSATAEEDTIATLTDENAALKDNMVRLQAEMANTRRRANQDVDKARKFGMEKLVEDLLPTLDSLDLGLQSIEDGHADLEKAKEGYVLITDMFNKVMEKTGIKVIDPQGERFDPEFHQAMTFQASDEVEANHVLKVFQKGYVLNERLVRPAMVVVAKAIPAPKEGGAEEGS